MDSEELALLALIGTGLSLAIAMGALIAAILDWHQVGREEPWNLLKVQDNIWVLERIHRAPVTVTFLLNFHGGAVDVLNGAGFPAAIFRRGRKEVLRIEPALGTSLTVFYRRSWWLQRAWNRLRKKGLPGHLRDWPSPEGMYKAKTWHTPVY